MMLRTMIMIVVVIVMIIVMVMVMVTGVTGMKVNVICEAVEVILRVQ